MARKFWKRRKIPYLKDLLSMRRVASHYIWYRQILKMHYLELQSDGSFVCIRPLTAEIAGTEFYTGILLPVPERCSTSFPDDLFSLLMKDADLSETGEAYRWMHESHFWDAMEKGEPVCLFLLNRIALSASELCTNNGCSNGYIQRL